MLVFFVELAFLASQTSGLSRKQKTGTSLVATFVTSLVVFAFLWFATSQVQYLTPARHISHGFHLFFSGPFAINLKDHLHQYGNLSRTTLFPALKSGCTPQNESSLLLDFFFFFFYKGVSM